MYVCTHIRALCSTTEGLVQKKQNFWLAYVRMCVCGCEAPPSTPDIWWTGEGAFSRMLRILYVCTVQYVHMIHGGAKDGSICEFGGWLVIVLYCME